MALPDDQAANARLTRRAASDLGPGFYDSRSQPERKKPDHIRQLEALGYKVILEPAA